jgi:hypothetical protein
VRRRLRFVWLLIDPFLFAYGLAVHLVTKKTPIAAAGSLRRLFVATDGRFNDAGARITSIVHPPVAVDDARGVLGELDSGEVEAVAHDIERNGFHVFDVRLDPATCERIIDFARRTPAKLVPAPKNAPAESTYDPSSPLAPRYMFEERRSFELPELQELATDRSFMAIAQAYLKCRPINDLVAFWWSPAFGDAPSSEAAQLFHFDMDRPKFIKFFVYLTDVDARHGPHVDVVAEYGADAIVEITGPAGTILAADTRGFHKGKAPEIGDRLLFQVEYANSLFGVPYNRIPVGNGWSDQALAQLRKYPAVFQRFSFA